MTSEARRICNGLANSGDHPAGAREVADRALQVWLGIDAELSPIIGSRGVAALYNRSLYLSRRAHPVLAQVPPQRGDDVFGALHERLSLLAPAEAAGAASALVEAFCDLLSNLIGTSLTERLLSAVRDHPSRGAAAQDTPP